MEIKLGGRDGKVATLPSYGTDPDRLPIVISIRREVSNDKDLRFFVRIEGTSDYVEVDGFNVYGNVPDFK